MTTTICENDRELTPGEAAEDMAMEVAMQDVADDMACGAGRADQRIQTGWGGGTSWRSSILAGLAARVARGDARGVARGDYGYRSRGDERSQRSARVWKAVAVSAAVHVVICAAAATIVLNQPARVDRRDAVMTLELGGMVVADAGPRAAVGVADAIEERSEEVWVREEDLAVDAARAGVEERTAEEEPVLMAATAALIVKEEEAAPVHQSWPRPSLAGWISGPHGSQTGLEMGSAAAAGDAAEGMKDDGRGTGEVESRPVMFAGATSQSAASVVYVVDASGPMVTSMRFVLEELVRSVWRLSETQSFNVVLFREDRAGAEDRSESFAVSLVPATEPNKRALARWLSGARPEGRSNPLVGLERGLRYEPEVVFLLSRSVERSAGGVWGDGLSATMARLEDLNPAVGEDGRGVQIQSIAFLENDPTGILQSIADAHGPRDGTGYRVVRGADELGAVR